MLPIWKKLKKFARLKQSDMDILVDFVLPGILGLIALIFGIDFANEGEWLMAVLLWVLSGVNVVAIASSCKEAIESRKR